MVRPRLRLSLFLDDKRGFAQLLAVKFLTAVRGPTVYDPLVHATSKDKWQVTRLSAMDGLASSPSVEKLTVIEALQTDEDLLVAKRAREIVDRMIQDNSKH